MRLFLPFIIALILGYGAEARAEKILRYSEDGSPSSLDPAQAATMYGSLIVTALYDTLYEYRFLARPYQLKPNLAEDMPTISKDGLTYTFKIKKGVMFIDDPAFPNGKGREVVAGDFVYSIKRNFDPATKSQGAWLWQDRIVGLDDWKAKGADYSKEVEGLKALDKYTIQIKLRQPYPQLVYSLAMAYSAFVPEEAVKKYGEEFAVKPVGSGPFRLKSHNASRSVLLKNKNFRNQVMDLKAEGYNEKIHKGFGLEKLDGKKLPIVDVAELHWINEPVAMWNSFTKGNEVVWARIPVEQANTVLASKNPITLKPNYAEKYFLRADIESGLVFTGFNMDDPSIGYNKDPKREAQNKDLRCAIRKGFNWSQRINRFYHGLGEAWPGVIPPQVDGYDPSLSKDSIVYDPEGAKALLAKSGWTPQTLPTLVYNNIASVRDKQFFEQFRGFMTAIGFPKEKIKQQTYATFGDFNKAVKMRKAMLIPMAWGLDYPDAENTLGLFYGPNASPGSNSFNYVNPKFDALFKKASVMQPSPERNKIYRELNQIVVDDCVAISSFSRTFVMMWHKNVTMWPQRDIISNTLKYIDVE